MLYIINFIQLCNKFLFKSIHDLSTKQNAPMVDFRQSVKHLLAVSVKTGPKLGLRAVLVLWCGEQLSRLAPSAWAISKGF